MKTQDDSLSQRIARIKEREKNLKSDLFYFTAYAFSIGMEKSGLTGIDKETGDPKPFIDDADLVRQISSFLQNNPWTLRVGPRDHYKSVSFYAHFCWNLFRFRNVNLDNYYFSYKAGLAAKHIANIKKVISHMPDFEDIKDLKPRAEGVLAYSWDGGETTISLEPAGMLEFKRGLHPKGTLYIDDPLRDPENKLDPTSVKKVNRIFTTEIIPMPHGDFHVVGTAQTNTDFFFDDTICMKPEDTFDDNRKKFQRLVQPAILDHKNKKVLFPEFRPWDWLMNKLELLKDKRFNQEYMCIPAYEEDSYFEREQLLKVVNESLVNYDLGSGFKDNVDVIAGYDIGKKRHPAHVSVFKVIEGDAKRYIQIYHKFLDRYDYIRQIELLTQLVKELKIDVVYYDATRGELEALDESGKLPAEFEPVNFNHKNKNAMATVFYKLVVEGNLELINDQRQIDQILAVNNDLQAIETEQGHGDSFWSNALALTDEIETYG